MLCVLLYNVVIVQSTGEYMATVSKLLGKRGTSYKVRIRKPNSPTVTKTFSSRNLAEKWARKTELAIEEGLYFDKVESGKHTIADLVGGYIKEDNTAQNKKIEPAFTRLQPYWAINPWQWCNDMRTYRGSTQCLWWSA